MSLVGFVCVFEKKVSIGTEIWKLGFDFCWLLWFMWCFLFCREFGCVLD